METGCRLSDIRRVSNETDFVDVLGDICEKIQVLRHECVPLKRYTFPRTLKKIRGNIVADMKTRQLRRKRIVRFIDCMRLSLLTLW